MKQRRLDDEERLRAALRRGDPAAGDALTPAEVRTLRRATLAAAEAPGWRRWLPIPAPVPAAAAAIGCVVVALALWRAGLPVAGGGKRDQVREGRALSAGEENAAVVPQQAGAAEQIAGSGAPRANLVATERPGHRGTSRAERDETLAAIPHPPTESVADYAVEVPGAARAVTLEELARAEIALTVEMARAAPSVTAAAETTGMAPLVASAPAAAEEVPGLKLQFSTPGGTRIIWVLASESES